MGDVQREYKEKKGLVWKEKNIFKAKKEEENEKTGN